MPKEAWEKKVGRRRPSWAATRLYRDEVQFDGERPICGDCGAPGDSTWTRTEEEERGTCGRTYMVTVRFALCNACEQKIREESAAFRASMGIGANV